MAVEDYLDFFEPPEEPEDMRGTCRYCGRLIAFEHTEAGLRPMNRGTHTPHNCRASAFPGEFTPVV